MRWNNETDWTWSAEPAHEPLVSRHDFETVQDTMRSNTRQRGPRTRTAPTRPYALRGKITCAICGRLMQAHQARGTHYYRCRYANEYAESAELSHPRNVYLREDDILPHLDAWLDELFAPDRIDHTLDILSTPSPTPRRSDSEHVSREISATATSRSPGAARSSTTTSTSPRCQPGSKRPSPTARSPNGDSTRCAEKRPTLSPTARSYEQH